MSFNRFLSNLSQQIHYRSSFTSSVCAVVTLWSPGVRDTSDSNFGQATWHSDGRFSWTSFDSSVEYWYIANFQILTCLHSLPQNLILRYVTSEVQAALLNYQKTSPYTSEDWIKHCTLKMQCRFTPENMVCSGNAAARLLRCPGDMTMSAFLPR
jgi:hypothetical protein